MARLFFKQFATVFTENGAHKVMLPSGEVIPNLIQSLTDDGVDAASVSIRFACNITASKEEALAKYKEL